VDHGTGGRLKWNMWKFEAPRLLTIKCWYSAGVLRVISFLLLVKERTTAAQRKGSLSSHVCGKALLTQATVIIALTRMKSINRNKDI